MNRSTYLLAGLALKQNEPTIALNLLPENKVYVTIRFLRLIAFTQSGLFDEACEILCRTADYYRNKRSASKPYFGIQMVYTAYPPPPLWNHSVQTSKSKNTIPFRLMICGSQLQNRDQSNN